MRLEKEQMAKYGLEISELYQTWLKESPTSGLIYFGAFDNEELKAVTAVRCYMGHWYLRALVVKPEYRGRGLQRALMNESLDYLSEKTDVARVSVFPDNFYSIRNIEAVGFKFEKKKKLSDGHEVLVYKFDLSSRNS
ncbi:MAG TPA: GNAT family N-acetyltransferase [Patescibacteria group bacterium]|nr:GNAT family N-acetyltransferase [Patescibacteria group bacterium]